MKENKISKLFRIFAFLFITFNLIVISFFSSAQSKSSITIPSSSAQNKSTQITIENANTLEGERINGVDVKKLIGNVILGHEGALMYCDSAFFYNTTNSADCFGNVRIVKGDSLRMNGDFLKYDGNRRTARLVKNVRMTDSKMVLTTDTLDYDRNSEIANYNYGAKITDKENNLTSKRGYYYTKDKVLFFKNDVKLDNPKYYLNCDTLKYTTNTKIAYFFGPTRIYSKGKDSTFIYCENGWYNTVNDKSYFGKNAFIQSKEQHLSGDSLLYDKKNGFGEAFGNVFIIDTAQRVMIQGDYGHFSEANNTSFVTGITTLTQAFDKDSLYLHADTLFASYDSVSKSKSYFAYHHVKIFKTDLQGKCDSLVYSSYDSLIRFYTSPVLWSTKNQLTADSISLQLANNKISKMYLYTGAFITSQEDSLRYNQVKGKVMTGYFEDNELKRIYVEGNGQTLYYGRNKSEQIIGVNQAECSDLIILIDSNKIKKITLLNKPDATFFPIKDAAPSDFLLKGFQWFGDSQPKKKEDIYVRD
ncbi:MAG: OstA-like protein [Bacteroidia bacterium]